jgi:hypothetical protein
MIEPGGTSEPRPSEHLQRRTRFVRIVVSRRELAELEKVLPRVGLAHLVERLTLALYLGLADAQRLVEALRAGGFPHLSRAVEGGISAVTPEDLSSQERTLIERVRSMRDGRLYVDVIDGTPTIAPQRHWRWSRRVPNSRSGEGLS